MNKIKFWIALQFHKVRCEFWNWRLPPDLNYWLNEWQKIDHRKDKSYTGKDFRCWIYMKKLK